MDTNTDRAMTCVRTTRFRDGIVIHIDNPVQVECNDLGDVVEFLEVVFTAGHKSGEGKRGEIAYSGLVGRGVFDDLSAEVGGLDSPEVLLVRFACKENVRTCIKQIKQKDLQLAESLYTIKGPPVSI